MLPNGSFFDYTIPKDRGGDYADAKCFLKYAREFKV